MTAQPGIPSADHLVLARERRSLIGDDSVLRRSTAKGELVRLNRGVYVPSDRWRSLNDDDRYLTKIHSVALSRAAEPMFSSYSAAAMWGLPIVGAWPAKVHLLAERASGGRSDAEVVRHAVGLEFAEIQRRDGLQVTGVARTLVDLASQANFMTGVAATDFALRSELTTKNELLDLSEALLPFRGSRRAARVIAFANGLSDSVLESVSRVNMARNRFPEPELQKRFVDPDGHEYWTDYWWSGYRTIGEADGRDKYENPEFLRGRTPEEALWDEKLREDWLRTQSDGFVRWVWEVAISRERLKVRLLDAGLPQLRPGHPDGFAVLPLG